MLIPKIGYSNDVSTLEVRLNICVQNLESSDCWTLLTLPYLKAGPFVSKATSFVEWECAHVCASLCQTLSACFQNNQPPFASSLITIYFEPEGSFIFRSRYCVVLREVCLHSFMRTFWEIPWSRRCWNNPSPGRDGLFAKEHDVAPQLLVVIAIIMYLESGCFNKLRYLSPIRVFGWDDALMILFTLAT